MGEISMAQPKIGCGGLELDEMRVLELLRLFERTSLRVPAVLSFPFEDFRLTRLSLFVR